MTSSPKDVAAAYTALGLQPPTGAPQAGQYFGARPVPGGVVQEWDIPGEELQRLRILWPSLGCGDADAVRAAAAAGLAVEQVLRVGEQSSRPVLYRHTATGTLSGKPTWSQLATVLGGRVPYWPVRLRIHSAIQRWRPGADPAIVAAVPSIDVAAAGSLAAVLAEGSPARRVVQHLLTDAMARAAAETRTEITLLSRGAWADLLDIAAHPLDVPVPARLPEDVCAAGWGEVMNRTDDLADAVVNAARWHPVQLPYAVIDDIDPASTASAQWVAQLEPVSREHQPAKFEMLRADSTHEEVAHLIDPHTGVPVIRYRTGRLRYAAPASLPVSSPLAEVVFDHQQVWIRVADGALYPAPRCGEAYGPLGYGADSSRSLELAVLLARLLDDIAAGPATSGSDRPPSPGLLRLTSTSWPDATVIGRADLETARTASS